MAKTLIFDLGGVLLDLDWDKVCAPLAERSDKGAGHIRREVIDGPLATRLMLGQMDAREFHQSLCERLGMELGYEEFVSIWVRLLTANQDIVPLVERLSETHRLVLASNTDQIHFTYSGQHFNVLSHFNEHFCPTRWEL